MKNLLTGVLFVAVLAAMSCGDERFEHEKKQQAFYCEMVKLFKSSNGDSGWPDYNKNFDIICKETTNKKGI